MKVNRNTVRSILYGITMLMILMCFTLVKGYAFVLTSSDKDIYVSWGKSKDQDADKNINSVKAMYNPVAEQISVSFKLAKQSTVNVKLMDALGNEVLTLSNSILDAGNQSLAFDKDSKVAPGFYFVKVSSGTESVVKRVSIR